MTEERLTQPEEIEEIIQETPEPVEEKKEKRWLKPLLFVVLGIILASGLVFAGYKLDQLKQVQPGPQPTPTSVTEATPTPDPTANWKTYTNEDFGFSIRYPQTWSKLVCGDSTVVFDPAYVTCESDAPGAMIIAILNEVRTPLITVGEEFKVITQKEINIGGLKGEEIFVEKIKPAPGPPKSITAAVANKRKIYHFNLAEIDKQQTFNLMLSTFRFLE